MKKNLLTTALLLLTLALSGCVTIVESTTEQPESTTQVSAKEKAKIKKEQQQKNAKEFDAKVLEICTKTDSSLNKLLGEIQNFSGEGSSNLLNLYNLAKTEKSNFLSYFSESMKLSCKDSDEYKNSLQLYISNCQMISESLMKYIDKKEMKYLNATQRYIEKTNAITAKLADDRITFLTSNGFTEKEATELLNEDN